MVVRVDVNISLDGYATTTDQTPESPFGGRLGAAGWTVHSHPHLPGTGDTPAWYGHHRS